MKDSKDAKEVPDKVIKALNVYLDNQIDKKIDLWNGFKKVRKWKVEFNQIVELIKTISES